MGIQTVIGNETKYNISRVKHQLMSYRLSIKCVFY